MKSTTRSAILLLLAALLLTAAALPALAVTYPADQYYEADTSAAKVLTVQVSVGTNLSAVNQRRDEMLKQGYDSFVYKSGNQYKVMCGKFRDQNAALDYCEDIHNKTDRKDAYVTNAYLPESAISAFESLYAGNEVTAPPAGGYGWEDPTGLYYNADAYTGPTTKYYTVQFSAGTSFSGAERARDAMIEAGFNSFVYKVDKKYRIMSGIFTDYADASERCERIKKETNRSTAYVTTVRLSSSSPSLLPPGSPTAAVTKDTEALAAPTLTGISDTASGVIVNWKAVPDAVRYGVLRKSGSGSWELIGSTTSTGFLDTTTASGIKYTYTVRCLTDDGSGYASPFDSAGLSIG